MTHRPRPGDSAAAPESITVTLPPAAHAEYRYGSSHPEVSGAMWPAEQCAAKCDDPIEEGDLVQFIATTSVDEAWLTIADEVIQRPSTFRASAIRAVMQNVSRIARRRLAAPEESR